MQRVWWYSRIGSHDQATHFRCRLHLLASCLEQADQLLAAAKESWVNPQTTGASFGYVIPVIEPFILHARMLGHFPDFFWTWPLYDELPAVVEDLHSPGMPAVRSCGALAAEGWPSDQGQLYLGVRV